MISRIVLDTVLHDPGGGVLLLWQTLNSGALLT